MPTRSRTASKADNAPQVSNAAPARALSSRKRKEPASDAETAEPSRPRRAKSVASTNGDATIAAAKKTATTANKKTTTTTKKIAKAPVAKKTTAAPKTASKNTIVLKRKVDDSELSETEDDEDAPKSKKAKATHASNDAPAKKTAAKKTAAPKKAAVLRRDAGLDKTVAGKTDAPRVDAKASSSEADVQSSALISIHTSAAKSLPALPKKPKRAITIGAKINNAPIDILRVFVFGEGSSGELGLGSKSTNGRKPIDVKRPRANHLLSPSVGVVQIACGGMHVAALTSNNKILTWGVNDQGALGRNTEWDGGLREMDADDDSGSDSDDDDDSGLNPLESTPTAVSEEHFAPGTKFVQLVACDSSTFVLTEDGRVYGWGTFRSSDGILGFTQGVKIQQYPMHLPTLKNIVKLAGGSNHVMALDRKGVVYAWGCGQQNQLGRRIIERNRLAALQPQTLGLLKNHITHIACGAYHSFALDGKGKVWAWGLNNFGETGIRETAGDDDAVILRPTIVTSLDKYQIVDIAGGEHHSVACAADGRVFSWGRSDGAQLGIPSDQLTAENAIYDDRGRARILIVPAQLPEITDGATVTCGTDHSIVVTKGGKAYSWGFSENYQTGQGTTEDVITPTLIDNSAVKDEQLVFAGAGGQYSILAGRLNNKSLSANGTHLTENMAPPSDSPASSDQTPPAESHVNGDSQ